MRHGLSEKEALQLTVKGTGSRFAILRVTEALLAMGDEELNACPSRTAIGKRAGVTERSVRRALKHMVLLGVVREEVRPRNTRRIYPNKIMLLAILDKLP
jgi:hypothetical protein